MVGNSIREVFEITVEPSARLDDHELFESMRKQNDQRTAYQNALVLSVAPFKARTDKTGRHVHCGRAECGTRFATVYIGENESGGADQSSENLLQNYIAFPPGWAPTNTPQGELWAQSKYAKSRTRQGRNPKTRRAHPQNGVNVRNSAMDTYLEPLPVMVTCPRCGWKNSLLREMMGVSHVLVVPADVLGNERR